MLSPLGSDLTSLL
jgi:hypothetical protein